MLIACVVGTLGAIIFTFTAFSNEVDTIPFSPARIEMCKAISDGNSYLVPIAAVITDARTINKIVRILNEGSNAARLVDLDRSGRLCYVAFFKSNQRDCLIVEIQVSKGLLSVYEGTTVGGHVIALASSEAKYYYNPRFVEEIFGRLNIEAHDYIEQLDSIFKSAAGKGVEEILGIRKSR